jgi:hypothetical protein
MIGSVRVPISFRTSQLIFGFPSLPSTLGVLLAFFISLKWLCHDQVSARTFLIWDFSANHRLPLNPSVSPVPPVPLAQFLVLDLQFPAVLGNDI